MSETAQLPDSAASNSIEPKTLVEAAYLRLRRDIIEGVRRPGEKLRVEHLKNTKWGPAPCGKRCNSR